MFVDYKREIKNIKNIFFVTYVIALCIGWLYFKQTSVIIDNGGCESNILYKKILINNIIVFILMCSGSLFNKISTYSIIITNAYLLGVNTPMIISLQIQGISILFHGVLELFGFFLAALIGMKPIQYHIKNKYNSYKILLLGLSMIVVSAIIEGYISYGFLKITKF
ncbi:Stage II sporulation protein M [Granulicatella balaenopterae]|uniref:Stage II sporulation protein M n=1 Tax=Granulicatella balaenopterae TaxID=137733 RepID=A0A1H9M6N9_9LACT|nr:stage II sporulation protein M [Granulicatella balaenopterae]SER19145.1 Stage II sporulation protein M [Granulicatella balaenopterae]